MSTTDQSFIRAFTRDTEDNGMNKSPISTSVAAPSYEEGTSRVVVSQPPISQSVVVAETYISLPESEVATVPDSLTQDTPVQREPVREIPASQPTVRHFRAEPSQSESPGAAPTTDTRQYRFDAGDTVMPPAPHIHKPPTATPEFDDSPARQTNQFATSQEDLSARQNPTRGIRPQWEVDRFRWPAVCDVLRDTSAHRLEDVVESLIVQTELGERIVAITSFDRNEGRSTIAMCLARLAANSKRDVALVDGDLDQPSIGQYLGVAFDTSWNRLDAKLPLGEAGIVSIKDQFVVFPANQNTAFPEREIRNHSGPLLATLSDAFDLVFVDIGPMFTAAHRWLMPESRQLIKSALVVRDVRRTTMDQVDDVCCRLVKSGVQNMAIIDNFQGLDD